MSLEVMIVATMARRSGINGPLAHHGPEKIKRIMCMHAERKIIITSPTCIQIRN